MEALEILIVDDHLLQREYMACLMRQIAPSHAITVTSGSSALGALQGKDFDLVVTDLIMPGLDGVQLIQAIAEVKKPPAVALVSASPKRLLGSACLVARLLGLRVIAQVCKPLRSDDVKSMLQNLALSRNSQMNRKPPAMIDKDKLIRAIENNRIRPWFQPKVALIDDSICGAEALCRWFVDDKTILLPGDFLPWLIFHKLEEDLLFKVVESSISAHLYWKQHGFDVSVSVNLPTHLMDSRSLPDRLLSTVISAGGDPQKITFELTEGTTTSNVSDLHAGACRLRMMGFNLSQDDFGQGYSSMYNLLSVPFTELKIDRALVNDCVTDEKVKAILESAVTLGRRLGIPVVAEGVETREQLELLRKLDCTAVQGFYVGMAMSEERLLKRLSLRSVVGPQKSDCYIPS